VGADEDTNVTRATLEMFEIVHDFNGKTHTVYVRGGGFPSHIVGIARSRYVAFARLYKQMSDFYGELAERERLNVISDR
jgi:hypothetical protein